MEYGQGPQLDGPDKTKTIQSGIAQERKGIDTRHSTFPPTNHRHVLGSFFF
jgi:hypothetical protein